MSFMLTVTRRCGGALRQGFAQKKDVSLLEPPVVAIVRLCGIAMLNVRGQTGSVCIKMFVGSWRKPHTDQEVIASVPFTQSFPVTPTLIKGRPVAEFVNGRPGCTDHVEPPIYDQNKNNPRDFDLYNMDHELRTNSRIYSADLWETGLQTRVEQDRTQKCCGELPRLRCANFPDHTIHRMCDGEWIMENDHVIFASCGQARSTRPVHAFTHLQLLKMTPSIFIIGSSRIISETSGTPMLFKG